MTPASRPSAASTGSGHALVVIAIMSYADGSSGDGPAPSISRRAAIRCSIGGCVSNSRLNQPCAPGDRWSRGDWIHRWAVAAGAWATTDELSRSFSSRGDQARRVPGDEHPGDVGEGLPAAGDGELHRLRGEGGQDDEDDGEGEEVDLADVPAVAAPAPDPAEQEQAQTEVGEERHEPDEGDGDGADEDVVVVDVAELVRQHPLELVAVHDREQPGRDRDRRVLGVAAGREGVGCRVVDQVDLRLREPDAEAELLDQVVEARVLVRPGRPGPGHGDGHPIRVEVAGPDHGQREDDGDRQHDGSAGERQVEDRGHTRDEDGEAGDQVDRAAPVGPDLGEEIMTRGHAPTLDRPTWRRAEGS